MPQHAPDPAAMPLADTAALVNFERKRLQTQDGTEPRTSYRGAGNGGGMAKLNE